MWREIAAAPTNVCFGCCGRAAWGEVDRQVWAECVDGQAVARGGELPHAGAAMHPQNPGIAAIGDLRMSCSSVGKEGTTYVSKGPGPRKVQQDGGVEVRAVVLR
jgi:hypothetical protein